MQSMQPIPIERALVPVLTAELTPKREPGLLARASLSLPVCSPFFS